MFHEEIYLYAQMSSVSDDSDVTVPQPHPDVFDKVPVVLSTCGVITEEGGAASTQGGASFEQGELALLRRLLRCLHLQSMILRLNF